MSLNEIIIINDDDDDDDDDDDYHKGRFHAITLLGTAHILRTPLSIP